MKVVVVGLGNAGQRIARIFKEKHPDVDVCVVSDKRFANLTFFTFDEVEELAKMIPSYDQVVLTAGLGGRGGDCLVELYGRLNNVTAFVAMPFTAEKQRVRRAKMQLVKLDKAFVKELDELVERMPNAAIQEALDKFDEEMAEEIAKLIKFLK